jgi:hypothetical protein
MNYLIPSDLEQILRKRGFDLSPTWDQVFDWFDNTYKLTSHIDKKSAINHYYKIVNYADYFGEDTTLVVDGFEHKYDARLNCLKKLIQLTS